MTTATTADALAAVRRLSFAMLEARDGRGLYETFASELFEVFTVDRVHVCRMAEDATGARATAYAPTLDGGVQPELEYTVPRDGPSGVHHVHATGEALHVPEAASSTLVAQQFVEQFSAASLLYVPLAYDGTVRSVVVLISHEARTFDITELELAYTLANQASAGLAVLDMRSRLSARAERRAALVRAASALNASLDLDEVLTTLCEQGSRALGADVAGFYFGDAEGGSAVAGYGIPEESDWWGSRVAPGQGMAGRVLTTGRPAITNDYQLGQIIETDVMRTVETAAGVPVRWDGELKGALSVGFKSLRPVLDEDIAVLQAIADLAAVACSNAEAFERERAAARTDSLTGFLNHGAIQARLREEIWRARRDELPLSCLLVDLDNFKPVNDSHGHLVGDELLQQVATAIAAEFRPYDGLARYGGDEFVLVLPGADDETALGAAQRLRTVVAEATARFGDLSAAVTASVGIARWREPLTAGELLDRADRALLLAKRRGKDGLAVAGTATERDLARVDQARAREDDPLAGFWDMVSRCERPRHVLYTLSALVRRELDLEEVALYEPGPGSQGRSLVRLALARLPGDPGQAAFRRSSITIGESLRGRLESGPISRGSLAALETALEVPWTAVRDAAPAGSYAALGLARGGTLLGVMLLRHKLPQFPRPVLRTAEVLGGEAATVLLSQSGDGSRTAVAALAAAIDARDNYTCSHSEEVVGLAREVARRLGLSPVEVSKVRDGAMLHDVGKVAIPNEILYKPGPLTDAEWEVMRQHPEIGESILRRTPELAPIAALVRHEHERWDGGGYPDGLAGESIPIGSRIIFACDAYNAMITERPYRQPMSAEAALAELRGGAGSQFDPRVVEALLAVLGAPVVASAE